MQKEVAATTAFRLSSVVLLLQLLSFTPLITVHAFSATPRSTTNFIHTAKERVQQIPAQNPTAPDDDAVSPVSGVGYTHVFQGLSALYPPIELDQRNALSRRDGYWPFINEGKDPPECFTYGEFDFYFFTQLLDRAHEQWVTKRKESEDQSLSNHANEDWSDKVFVDIGSGAGRLVVAAATLHPTWKKCCGIELLSGMHESAQDIVEQNCRFEVTAAEVNVDTTGDKKEDLVVADEDASGEITGKFGKHAEHDVQSTMERDDDAASEIPDEASATTFAFRLPIDEENTLPMAPIELVCGSFSDPYVHFGDADLIFMFSSALDSHLLTELSCSIGRQCRPGTLVITTDYMLDLEGSVPSVPGDDRFPSGNFKFSLPEKLDGYCWCTGGEITAYIHRLEESVNPLGIPEPLERPIPTVEDVCYEVAMMRERGKLTDSDRFLRGVANNVRFEGLPEAFVPRSYR